MVGEISWSDRFVIGALMPVWKGCVPATWFVNVSTQLFTYDEIASSNQLIILHYIINKKPILLYSKCNVAHRPSLQNLGHKGKQSPYPTENGRNCALHRFSTIIHFLALTCYTNNGGTIF